MNPSLPSYCHYISPSTSEPSLDRIYEMKTVSEEDRRRSWQSIIPIVTESSSDKLTNHGIVKKANSIRVPCKARGLSTTHTALTAYLEIPHNAPHGMLLVCSHVRCSRSRRRFRYCAECKVPVAKRNFTRRHDHGRSMMMTPMTTTSRDDKKDGVHYLDEDDTTSTSQSSKKQRLEYIASSSSTISDDSHNEIPRTVTVNDSRRATDFVDESDKSPVTMELTEREVKWLDLLKTFPYNMEISELEKWFYDILQMAKISTKDTTTTEDGLTALSNAQGETSKDTRPDSKQWDEDSLSSLDKLEDGEDYEREESLESLDDMSDEELNESVCPDQGEAGEWGELFANGEYEW